MNNSSPKKRFSLGRVARLTFRTLALAMLVAFIVGWVVSYWGMYIVGCSPTGDRMAGLLSYSGRLTFNVVDQRASRYTLPLSMRQGWSFTFEPIAPEYADVFADMKPFQFRWLESGFDSFLIAAPYWFLTTLAAMAAALSFKRTWRFTTRQLLIATTAVALLLGAVAWSLRG